MKNILYVWKPVGFTPLGVVKKIKQLNSEYENEIISYAGRLDPMAEGVLVLLIGDENKNREKYLDLKKEYESEIILGISTDTFDSLGLVSNVNFKEIYKEEIEKILKSFLGKQKQIYPPYSSKAVNGKPLFWWSRQGKIHEIEIPDHEIEIYAIEILGFEMIKVNQLVEKILAQIKNIKGDFRQGEIIDSWKKIGEEFEKKEFLKIKININCSSGTYVRRLADDLGKKMGTGAFAYSIKRTRVGDISENECLSMV